MTKFSFHRSILLPSQVRSVSEALMWGASLINLQWKLEKTKETAEICETFGSRLLLQKLSSTVFYSNSSYSQIQTKKLSAFRHYFAFWPSLIHKGHLAWSLIVQFKDVSDVLFVNCYGLWGCQFYGHKNIDAVFEVVQINVLNISGALKSFISITRNL